LHKKLGALCMYSMCYKVLCYLHYIADIIVVVTFDNTMPYIFVLSPLYRIQSAVFNYIKDFCYIHLNNEHMKVYNRLTF
jgi:hypothetical protein